MRNAILRNYLMKSSLSLLLFVIGWCKAAIESDSELQLESPASCVAIAVRLANRPLARTEKKFGEREADE